MPRTPPNIAKTSAIVLAAGAGSRFRAIGMPVAEPATDRTRAQPAGTARHKLLADLRGRPVVHWALDAVLGAGFAEVIVVTGAVALELPPTLATRVTEVRNPDWADGQATSLQCGLRTAEASGAEAVVIGLGDQPFITSSAWRAVASADAEIAVATYAGARANPVLLRRSIWALLPSNGDQGARSLMALRPDLVGEVACSGSPADIDTMEDLQQWNSSTNSP